MKIIPINGGYYGIVDDEDYPVLSRFSWQLRGTNKDTVSTVILVGKKAVFVPMIRLLYVPKIQYKPIFINKNFFDHRKENIKLVTASEFNGTSAKMYTTGKGNGKRKPTSKYKGVCFRKSLNRWQASIQFQKKVKVKTFKTEDEAGLWYNERAREMFGEHAYQNKI